MKREQQYTLISLCTCASALLFFAIYNQWIIFTVPKKRAHEEYDHVVNKKNVPLFYFSKGKWQSEKVVLLWSESNSENLNKIVQAWLMLLDEEKITQKKINFESALVSHAGVAYLSFDHTLFSKENSLHKKWTLIESLLKTVREADLELHSVQLLVHHQKMHDYHLDFSKPWPIHGFIIQ